MTLNDYSKIEARAAVRAALEAEGLEFLGVGSLAPEPDFPRFEAWLAEGRHAGMTFLTDNLAVRSDPRLLLAGARSVIVVGFLYGQGDKRRGPADMPAPRVAQYARLADYHKIIWRRGERVVQALRAALDPEMVGRVVADSAPILERALAARSGAGFIGKNTCLIHPTLGSMMVLGEIITSLDLVGEDEAVGGHQAAVGGQPAAVSSQQAADSSQPAADSRQPTAAASATDGCGSCRRCQVHCPTGALDADYRLDSSLCLSYWTIEHRGTIPERFWPWLKEYVYGCDLCQMVCPFNRGAPLTRHPELVRILPSPNLYELAVLTDAGYELHFHGTPMIRARRDGLIRNGLIAMTVTEDPRLEKAIAVHTERGEPGEHDMIVDTIAQIRRWQARRLLGETGVDLPGHAHSVASERNHLA
jgi:epoxyqueuosine reductase